MNFLSRLVGILAISVTSIGSQAQVVDPTVWTEKWPTSITETNVVSEYLRATYGRIGEFAAGKLDACLASTQCRAKMSAAGASAVVALINDSSKNNDQKAQALIAAIDADVGAYISNPTPNLGITAQASPKYSAIRLTWNRQTQQQTCQATRCTCPTGLTYPATQSVPWGSWCNWTVTSSNGAVNFYSAPPSCSNVNEIVDFEPEYKIYRSGKLIGQFAETKKITRGGNFSFNFLTGKLSGTFPSFSSIPSGRAGAFYDYDQQFVSPSLPLRYKIVAASYGCGFGYNNYLTGQFYREEEITVDGNADGVPDFYPNSVWASKLAEAAPAGSQTLAVSTNTSQVTAATQICNATYQAKEVGRATITPTSGTAPFTVTWAETRYGLGGISTSGGLSPVFYVNSDRNSAHSMMRGTVRDKYGKVGYVDILVLHTTPRTECFGS